MTTDEPADQRNGTIFMIINGVHMPINPVALKSTAGASAVYQFSKAFSFLWNGHVTTYRQNGTYALDPAQKAALIAAGAPMAQQ